MVTVRPDLDDLDGFFDSAVEIPRDQWGRPRVIPPGQTKRPRNGYTRASSVAGYLESSFAVDRWRSRRLAKGLAEHEDLCAMAAALPRFQNDTDLDRETNSALDPIIEQAIEYGQAHEQANWGTAIHRFIAPGGNVSAAPARMRPDIDSYFRWLEENRLIPVASEIFVVDDRLQIAGTFDGLFECPDGAVRLGDYKTGRDKPLSVLVQLASYADGQEYSMVDERGRVLADIPNFDNRRALHIWIEAGKARTEAREVDLEAGRLFRDIAIEVREARKAVKEYVRPMPDYAAAKRAEALSLIPSVTSRDEAQGLFETFRRVWNGETRAAMTAHLTTLGAT